jgi:gag-polypeptide of LTR copia-type
MKEKKTLKEYFSKAIELVNQIKKLGENLTDKSICEKILISVSPKYNNIVTIIEETKDLSTLNIQDLMSSLEMHEQRLNRFNDSFRFSKVNVKKSSNQNVIKDDASHGGRNGRTSNRNGRGEVEVTPKIEKPEYVIIIRN